MPRSFPDQTAAPCRRFPDRRWPASGADPSSTPERFHGTIQGRDRHCLSVTPARSDPDFANLRPNPPARRAKQMTLNFSGQGTASCRKQHPRYRASCSAFSASPVICCRCPTVRHFCCRC
ncbi:hypothetical protein EMIT0232MI5_60118 [Pseudomonas sp. IT-232MI5]